MAEKKANANHTNATGNSSVQSDVTNNIPTKLQSTTRLTSFLTPRDLTLGGNSVKLDKGKKIYTPNLNAQRKKKEDEPVVVQKNTKSPRNKHKGKGGDKEKGSDWKRNQNSKYIQSSGVFTEGLAEAPRARARFSGYRESSDRSTSRESLERPKLNANRVVDKEEEERKLKLLLRDDFIDDDDDDDKEFENQVYPTVLPIISSEGKFLTDEVKIESDDQTNAVEGEKLKTGIVKNDKKMNFVKGKFCQDVKDEKKVPLNISQSFENKENGYFVVRFPDCLPSESVDDEEDVRPRKNAELKTEKQKAKTDNIFDNLKEGFLGKIQILKSGAARLCLGNHNLLIELAPHVFFREDVIVANLDNENNTGELINLGPVHTNLICTPDWENLLKLQV